MPEATDNTNHAICCFPICVFIHLNDKCTMAYLWPSKSQHYYALWGHYYVEVRIKCEHCGVRLIADMATSGYWEGRVC